MARIVMADDGVVFDGKSLEHSPLGGAESAFINLAEAFVKRGHEVIACNNCEAPLSYKGIDWRPIKNGLPEEADLYIANRGDKLILGMPKAKRTVFWVHNPARYLMKWRYLWKLAVKRPTMIFGGEYHASTFPSWLPLCEKIIIPLGLPDIFCDAAPVSVPPSPPQAIFVSNPLRGLDWLLNLWEERIKPYAPESELHVFSGSSVYNLKDEKKNQQMKAVLEKAEKMADAGVKVRTPVTKELLLEELQKSRVLLYRGDINETFCLAVGEAQAAGVPAVVKPIGSVTERVVHGLTGVIADDDEAFAQAAVELLTDDEQWRYMKNGAISTQRDWRWDNAAEAFEMLIPELHKKGK